MPNAGLDPYDCDCGWLARAANDPTVSIGFDPEVNEYYLETGTPGGPEGRYVIRFCPWCGGDAPASHRDSLFETVTAEESVRLKTLWSTLRTRDEVVRAWGPPDEYIPQGYGDTEPEREGKATRTVYYDLMRYNSISPTAVVDVIVCPGDRVMFTYVTKVKGHEG